MINQPNGLNQNYYQRYTPQSAPTSKERRQKKKPAKCSYNSDLLDLKKQLESQKQIQRNGSLGHFSKRKNSVDVKSLLSQKGNSKASRRYY